MEVFLFERIVDPETEEVTYGRTYAGVTYSDDGRLINCRISAPPWSAKAVQHFKNGKSSG